MRPGKCREINFSCVVAILEFCCDTCASVGRAQPADAGRTGDECGILFSGRLLLSNGQRRSRKRETQSQVNQLTRTLKAPAWAYATFALGLFFYQTLDAIDGKQARRTKTASPLGELFDHGISN